MARFNVPAALLSVTLVGALLAVSSGSFDIPQLLGAVRGTGARGLAQAAKPDDCRVQVRVDGNGYEFTPYCPGEAPSRDGRWLVVKDTRWSTTARLVRTSDRATTAQVSGLNGEQTYTLYWSPDSRWFFINQRTSRGTDTLRLFRLADDLLSEQRKLPQAALRLVATDQTCARFNDHLSGLRWKPDGRLSMHGGSSERPCIALDGNVQTGSVVRAVLTDVPMPRYLSM